MDGSVLDSADDGYKLDSDDVMMTELDILQIMATMESLRADIEDQVEDVIAGVDANATPSEIDEVWGDTDLVPDSEGTGDLLYSRSLETNGSTGQWQMYDFLTAAGNVSLADSDWGTGGNKYLALVRHNITGDKPTLKYADISTATQDVYVAARSTDTTPGFLYDELTVGKYMTKTIVNPAGDENVLIGIDPATMDGLIYPADHQHAWIDLSDTDSGLGSSGDIIFNNGGTLTAVDPETLLGKHWVQGDGVDTCYGTDVGRADKTKVIDLDERQLVDGDWDITNSLYVTGEAHADDLAILGDKVSNSWNAGIFKVDTDTSAQLTSAGLVTVGSSGGNMNVLVNGTLDVSATATTVGSTATKTITNWTKQGWLIGPNVEEKEVDVKDHATGGEITIKVLAIL